MTTLRLESIRKNRKTIHAYVYEDGRQNDYRGSIRVNCETGEITVRSSYGINETSRIVEWLTKANIIHTLHKATK